jgi:L-alanine-DL-glutamate epimerase-like enolase superfamily enzyme
MKITDVRTTLLTGPCTNDPFLREARKRRSAAFIEVFTDGGVTGIGETYAGYFCPETVPSIVEFFKPILLEQTVEDIPELWRRMYQCGNFWWDSRCMLYWAARSTHGCLAMPRAGQAIIRRTGWRRRSTTISRWDFAD